MGVRQSNRARIHETMTDKNIKRLSTENVRRESLERQMDHWNKNMQKMYAESATMALSDKTITGAGTVRSL